MQSGRPGYVQGPASKGGNAVGRRWAADVQFSEKVARAGRTEKSKYLTLASPYGLEHGVSLRSLNKKENA